MPSEHRSDLPTECLRSVPTENSSSCRDCPHKSSDPSIEILRPLSRKLSICAGLAVNGCDCRITHMAADGDSSLSLRVHGTPYVASRVRFACVYRDRARATAIADRAAHGNQIRPAIGGRVETLDRARNPPTQPQFPPSRTRRQNRRNVLRRPMIEQRTARFVPGIDQQGRTADGHRFCQHFFRRRRIGETANRHRPRRPARTPSANRAIDARQSLRPIGMRTAARRDRFWQTRRPGRCGDERRPSRSSPTATLYWRTSRQPPATTAATVSASAAPSEPRLGSFTSITSAPPASAIRASSALRTLTSKPGRVGL